MVVHQSGPVKRGRRRWVAVALGALLIGAMPLALASTPASAEEAGERRSSLEPSYQPAVETPSRYTTEYFFSLTRGLADSTLATPAKVTFFVFTIPLDIALLPVSLIAGFFPPS